MAGTRGGRSVARILFDEFHGEAWSIRREVACALHPEHPEDSSYALAADALAARDFAVAANAESPLTHALLADVDVLVIAHPSDPKWERTAQSGSPVFAAEEIDAVESFVRAGGGLIVLGETEQDKYGTNVNELLARFGLEIENATVQDYVRHLSAPSWVLAEPGDGVPDLLAGVDGVCFYRAGTIASTNGARVIARSSLHASPPLAPLAAATEAGAGRVVVAADSDLFGDDCIGELDHEAFWLNLVHWVAEPVFRRPVAPASSPAQDDPAWRRLERGVAALRLLQQPDGSVAAARHDDARACAGAIAAAVRELAHHFPHQDEYLAALPPDLEAWVDGGFARPDFARSLALFRPELQREDGIEHLALFPMYTQNGSRDTRFEALIVRVPWPEWLAELERTRFDNPKFVPVTFVDHTAGYDSESAVLFPETVAVSGPPANHFGAIFCDREAERFRRVVSRAAALLRLNLPPDAACLLGSEAVSRDAYALWDLIHDRAHSRGDLPFDPFMIRQRMPYWMYSLEELRCDLTAFCEAAELEREGLFLGRHVRYAILFDRLFRFPVTGTRVRNYDGLGGQLLFAFLHRHDVLRWTDNQLWIDWRNVSAAVAGLRDRVERLYRRGIDLPKVPYWLAAHELVSEFVEPTISSKWAAGRRVLDEDGDPKAWIDLVADDEFPLSIFYTSLQQKLAPELVRAAA